MLRLHLRKVPAEHEIGFLKKKLGSTQFRENLVVLASCYVLLLPQPEEPAP